MQKMRLGASNLGVSVLRVHIRMRFQRKPEGEPQFWGPLKQRCPFALGGFRDFGPAVYLFKSGDQSCSFSVSGFPAALSPRHFAGWFARAQKKGWSVKIWVCLKIGEPQNGNLKIGSSLQLHPKRVPSQKGRPISSMVN